MNTGNPLKRIDTLKRIGIGFMLAGLGLVFFHNYPDSCRYSGLIKAFYANFSAEFISIAITILLVDHFYEKREIKNKKEKLIRELGSTDKAFTSRAAKELRDNGWLQDGTLCGANLKFANLTELDLSGADLKGVNLERSILANTNFNGANLSHAILNDSVMDGAILEKAILISSQLKSCKLYKANFNWATINDAEFMHSQCNQAEFYNATIIESKFEFTNFEFANFKKANLKECLLLNSDFQSAALESAIFESCDYQGIKNWEHTVGLESARILAPRNLFQISTSVK